MVVRYNTDRYLDGTLPHYDIGILYRAGSAGVLPALDVYKTTQDDHLCNELLHYFRAYINIGDASKQSLESIRARDAISSEEMLYNLLIQER